MALSSPFSLYTRFCHCNLKWLSRLCIICITSRRCSLHVPTAQSSLFGWFFPLGRGTCLMGFAVVAWWARAELGWTSGGLWVGSLLPFWVEIIDGQQRLALCQVKSLWQSLMCRLCGATSPDSEAQCAVPFGQVIDSSVIALNGSCIGIQCHLRIRETRSLALIGPPCVRWTSVFMGQMQMSLEVIVTRGQMWLQKHCFFLVQVFMHPPLKTYTGWTHCF